MKLDPSLDVTREPVSLSSETEETTVSGDLPTSENKRRRLIGGAVALAPLVLTLRSGGVAAASCTGARLVNLPENGQFSGAEGDVCIPEGANVCTGYASDIPVGQTEVTTKIVTQPETKVVAVRISDNLYICPKVGDEPFYANRPMAILSSQAAASLI